MHEYTVKTQEGTTKSTDPSPAKAAKITVGGSVIRCKHSELHRRDGISND